MVANGVREWCLPGPAPPRADRRCSGSDPAGQRLPQRGKGRGGGPSRVLVTRPPTSLALRLPSTAPSPGTRSRLTLGSHNLPRLAQPALRVWGCSTWDLWVVSSWSTGVTAIAGPHDMAWTISMSMRYVFIGRPMVRPSVSMSATGSTTCSKKWDRSSTGSRFSGGRIAECSLAGVRRVGWTGLDNRNEVHLMQELCMIWMGG